MLTTAKRVLNSKSLRLLTWNCPCFPSPVCFHCSYPSRAITAKFRLYFRSHTTDSWVRLCSFSGWYCQFRLIISATDFQVVKTLHWTSEFRKSSCFSFKSNKGSPDVTIRSRDKSVHLSNAPFSSRLVFIMNNNHIPNGCGSVRGVLSSITMWISQFE